MKLPNVKSKIVNNLEQALSNSEKTAVKFTLHSLEATLCGYILLLAQLSHAKMIPDAAFYARALSSAKGAAEYLNCAFFLSVACGVFLNAAIKSEKKKRG